MTSKNLYLGVECGGSKTTAILADENFVLLKQVVIGPTNLRLLNDEELHQRFKRLKRVFPHFSAIGVGMAGVRSIRDANRVRSILSSLWPGVSSWIGNDLEIAMEAAILKSPYRHSARIVVVSGTGSCIYGRKANRKSVKVGGWGHHLGDRGSGYDIAVRALRLCIRELDRTGRWPHLGQRMLRSLQMNNPDELIDWISTAPKDSIASLAQEVMKAWNQRDSLANLIVTKAADILVTDIVACAARMRVTAKKRVEIFLNGGVIKNNRNFMLLIKKKLLKTLPCCVSVLDKESAWGAVIMAKDCISVGRTRNDINMKESTCPLPESTELSPTEMRNPKSLKLDQLSTTESVNLMLEEESTVVDALFKVRGKIARAVETISECFRAGGRLFYVGSGTSGRLGILDATECPPTFCTDPDIVQGIIAGGQKAIWSSIEGAEDSFHSGYDSVLYRGVRKSDIIVGIAACGTTPFVWGAIQAGLHTGTRTIFLCFNPHLKIPRSIKPHIIIATDLGPEVLTGSTRLKTGTATKILLNTFTTLSMVRLGRVISNLMVDLNPANDKLRRRAARIVVTLTGCSEEGAKEALIKHHWNVKKCISLLANKRS